MDGVNIALLAAAILLLTLGHYCKTLRWRLSVATYENVSRTSLMRALSVGYLVNFYVPFHVGDLVRAGLAGRHMENGFAFSLASVVIDRALDVATMMLIFWGCTAALPQNSAMLQNALLYSAMTAVILLVIVLAQVFRQPLKSSARRVCGLFNEGIELRMLLFFWALITAAKDVVRKVSKGKMLLYTVLMWCAYLSSYAVFAGFLRAEGMTAGLSDIVLLLFHQGSLRSSTSGLALGGSWHRSLLMAAYILLPLALLLAASLWSHRVRTAPKPAQSVSRLLPQMRAEDRLSFLQAYFDDRSREYLHDYLEINREISIIRDYSAGSAATTMLCLYGDETVFRKYAFGAPADKLAEQVVWIEQNAARIPLPRILRQQRTGHSFYYDMEYRPAAVGMFQYIHSHPTAQSRALLREMLDTLEQSLYRPTRRPADPEALRAYLTDKVQKNLEALQRGRSVRALLQYDTLVINGVRCDNLPLLRDRFAFGWLEPVFADDPCSVIHGDLTVENIVCDEAAGGLQPFYFIDPNTGNRHDSPYLDYAKLLQSLHGKYEFLNRVPYAEVSGNRVDFLFSYTKAYEELYHAYDAYLLRTLGPAGRRSVYYHELIHWLRLLPYQMLKSDHRSVLYYAGFLLAANDMFGRIEEEQSEGASGDL